MEYLKELFFYPLFTQDDFTLAPINLIIFIGLFLFGKLVIKYLKKLFKSKELVDKKFTVEGKEIPLWRLIKQLVWLGIFFIGIKTFEVNNPELKSSKILEYEFIRFKDFHVAVYHLFVALFIVFFSRIALASVRIYLQGRLKRRGEVDEGSMYVYLQLTKYVIIVLAIIFMLRSMGVDLDLFITSMAFLLVGLGLGLQDIFKDFFAGLLLLFEGSIMVGDIVEIDRPKEENFVARIVEINLRTSKVETRDGKVLIVPNSNLSFQPVNNWTSGKHATRFNIILTVDYGSDLEQVKRIMIDCAKQHPKVLKSKDVFVRLRDFANNGYELDVVFWANQSFYIDIHKSEIRFAIDKEFRKNGIGYPYPQMDVHMIPTSPKAAHNPTGSEEENDSLEA
ncbi:MAG: mechanosensitive ion channel [Crocinitomicaceae bacterium]|nr:mechanosensitive ion channel [Crocinitomicaceae bacterium]